MKTENGHMIVKNLGYSSGKALGVQKAQLQVAKKLRENAQVARVSPIDRIALFDSSGSMTQIDAIGMDGKTCTRFHALRSAWLRIAPLGKDRLGAYVFSNSVQAVKGSARGEPVDLPFLGGGTAMCAALRTARKHATRNANLAVLLVSDGLPTDGEPVGVAVSLRRPVHCIYVGPRSNREGRDKLRAIAETTGGEFIDMGSSFDAQSFLENATRVLQLEEKC